MKKLWLVLMVAASSQMASFAQFELPKLDYSYSALEPYIDAETMEIHYSKHHQAYVTNLNNAIKGTGLEKWKLEDILSKVSKQSDAVRNNAGGHYNHTLFWSLLTPNKNTKASDVLTAEITKYFGSIDNFKKQMNDAASKRFGSGWAWLIVNKKGQLVVTSTPNQDNPLMDVVKEKGYPIIGIDVWEHAYYLKYQNKRGDYLSAIWNVLDWDEVSKRYQDALIHCAKK